MQTKRQRNGVASKKEAQRRMGGSRSDAAQREGARSTKRRPNILLYLSEGNSQRNKRA